MDWLREFKNPAARCRIKPFWFWNGDLSEEEINHQLEEMAEKGLGGAFICARQGQRVPYLSAEWFDKIKKAQKKAEALGLEVWLYDEYPYPSGMSGGEVLLRHPEAEHKVLKHWEFDLPEGGAFEENLGWCEELFAKAFPIKKGKIDFHQGIDLMEYIGILQTEEIYQTTGLTAYNNKRYFTYRPEKILKGELPEGNWHVEVYGQAPLGDFKYYGGYFDPCSKEAVKTFLETTHERYAKSMGEAFGKGIYGMFSDEVGLLSPIPWSGKLPEYFERIKGYSLLDHLPALHNADYENAYSIRYDLYDAIHKLFVESYHKQVSDWCKNHQLEYATEVPSMRMSTQRYSAIVGGDTAHEKLGQSLDWIYDKYLRRYRSNSRSVSSLTRQLGQRFAMIESFHSLGWSMTLQDAKWMFDRLAAEGINFYNVHAFYYTTDSITKHDAPPSQFLQNPYWKHYKQLADYTGRLGTWITNTEADIHLAVLDPAANLWALLGEPSHGFDYQGENEEERRQCDSLRDDWVYVCKELIFAQVGYEHLDTEILESAQIDNGEIHLGRACYNSVVIPPCDFIESAAWEKLCEFEAKGGKLIFTGRRPSMLIDKKQAKIDWEMKGEFFTDIQNAAWVEYCKEASGQAFEITGGKRALLSSVREDEKFWYIFLTNQGKDKLEVKVKAKNTKCAYVGKMVLETGDIQYDEAEPENGIILQGYESRLLMFTKNAEDLQEEKKDVKQSETERIFIDAEGWLPVSIEGDNVFRLDKFEASRDGSRWENVVPKTFVEQCSDSHILGPEDYQYVGDFGVPRQIIPAYPLTVTYRTHFYVQELPENCMLMMDQGALAGIWKMKLNGRTIPADCFAPHFVYDRSNRGTDVAALLVTGWNELTVEMEIHRDDEGLRDPLYLLGDFGVSEPEKEMSWNKGNLGETEGVMVRKITEKPEKAKVYMDYIRGFPYYTGTVTFCTTFTVETITEAFQLELSFGEECHDCIEVIVNGASLGTCAFAPNLWSGKGAILHKGENKVEIRLTNTLAAMLDGTWFDYKEHKLRKI